MNRRLRLLDSLRGLALLLMLVYHFAFDLNLEGAAHIDFQRPFWLGFRAIIMLLFLGLTGIGTSLAGTRKYWRWLRLGACAALVSLGTRWLFPDTWVFFGILHFIFVVSFVGPWFVRMPAASLPLGIALLAVPLFFRSAEFDHGLLPLTGLALHSPHSLDFVPFCPWFGIVLLGIYAGELLRNSDPAWAQTGNQQLARLGRHTLLIYMTHQALLLPLAWLLARS